MPSHPCQHQGLAMVGCWDPPAQPGGSFGGAGVRDAHSVPWKIFGNAVKINLGTGGVVGWGSAMGCGVAEPAGPNLDGHRCPGASGSGSIPSQLREWLLPPEQGMWIGFQDTETGTRPKFSPMAPCGSCPALPLSPRGTTLGSGCPRRRRNRWKTGLNVPGVKSIAGHGHAGNQPSNRINGERSCWKGSVGTCAPGALPCHPPGSRSRFVPVS